MNEHDKSAYEIGYHKGYSAGLIEGQKAFGVYLTRQAELSIKPMCFCAKCGKELGLSPLNTWAERTLKYRSPEYRDNVGGDGE